jgi:catechol 2,3-dioxygenase
MHHAPTRLSLPAPTHTGQVHLRVSDLDRSLGFYRDILGYHVESLGDRSVQLRPAQDQPSQFRLDEVPGVPPMPRRMAGLYHAAIRVPTRQDLARTIRRLIDHEWNVPGLADHGVSEAFYLNDPDGNGLEIYRDRPREEWPYRNGILQMGSDPIDLDSLFGTLEDAEPDDGSMAGGSDIGHVHLQVSSLKAAERFYVELLGFEVTQRSYRGALFVSAGGYHHHIGLNVWAGEGVPSLAPDVAGLIDFTVLVPDTSTLDMLAERLEQAGVTFERPDTRDGSSSLLTHDSDGIGVVLRVETES